MVHGDLLVSEVKTVDSGFGKPSSTVLTSSTNKSPSTIFAESSGGHLPCSIISLNIRKCVGNQLYLFSNRKKV